MDFSVLKLVLLLSVEDDAVVVDVVQDGGLPEGARQKLHHEVVLPPLHANGVTSSPSLFFFLGASSSSFFLPNSQSSITIYIHHQTKL